MRFELVHMALGVCLCLTLIMSLWALLHAYGHMKPINWFNAGHVKGVCGCRVNAAL